MLCLNNYVGSSIFCLARACAARSPGDRGRGGDGTVGYRNIGRRQGGSTKLGLSMAAQARFAHSVGAAARRGALRDESFRNRRILMEQPDFSPTGAAGRCAAALLNY